MVRTTYLGTGLRRCDGAAGAPSVGKMTSSRRRPGSETRLRGSNARRLEAASWRRRRRPNAKEMQRLASAIEHEYRPAPMPHPRLWVERLTLTGFRNYGGARLGAWARVRRAHRPQRLRQDQRARGGVAARAWPGLRQTPFPDLARAGGDGSWSVSARVHTAVGAVIIGTGHSAEAQRGERRRPPRPHRRRRQVRLRRSRRVRRDGVASRRRPTDCSPAPPPSAAAFSIA